MEQDKDERGRFVVKGEVARLVRSIRLTDQCWKILGEKAEDNDMSKADYLEALVRGEINWDDEENQHSEPDLNFDPDEVAELLKEALTLKANAGGKIKLKIKEALELMGFDPDED
jgi:hypothetical protein